MPKDLAIAGLRGLTYHCGTLGQKIVTVTVSDGQLTADTQVDIFCRENPDAVDAATTIQAVYVILAWVLVFTSIGCCCYVFIFKRIKSYVYNKGKKLSWFWCYNIYLWARGAAQPGVTQAAPEPVKFVSDTAQNLVKSVSSGSTEGV